MPFSDFLGNAATVTHLRQAIAAGRLPSAMILAGPRGAGKYTLSIMLAQAIACLQQPVSDGLPDFCGVCSNCTRIAASLPLESRVVEAVAAREEMREADKKDTRILVQTHPDVLVIPPDPPQLLIKLGQVRSVISHIYRMPAESPRAFYVFTAASFMKEAANSLLKVLEEPPEFAHILLLAENTGELLPTIRSRASIFRLGALPLADIEGLLASRRTDLSPKQRALVARLAEGAAGQALAFPLGSYLASRADALILLRTATTEPDHSTLFRMTETYRAGAEGQEKTANLLGALASLLEDLLLAQSGATPLMRNVDIAPELVRLSQSVSFDWIESAGRALVRVEQGLRRNLLRSLSLDAFAAEIAR